MFLGKVAEQGEDTTIVIQCNRGGTRIDLVEV